MVEDDFDALATGDLLDSLNHAFGLIVNDVVKSLSFCKISCFIRRLVISAGDGFFRLKKFDLAPVDAHDDLLLKSECL
jgi:hypothetical protein